MHLTNHHPPLLLTLITLTTLTHAADTPPNPKRGISWITTESSSRDNQLLTSASTPLSWYKSWGATPIGEPYLSALEFVPMIHGLENMESDIRTIGAQDVEYVLTFNEPDGDTGSGGTAITAEDAAKAWAEVVKLRDGGKTKKKISTPATTGSDNGWEWLQAWNESCWELYEDTGCEVDFVAAHWYGPFEGLAGWAGRLHEAYPGLDVWVTELALPQPATAEEVVGMMNQSLAFLDGLDWLARYAWFGGFREDEANGWTGEVVALFDDHGGLTELGAVYMGGEQRGFEVGEGGDGSGVGRRRVEWWLMGAGAGLAALLLS